MSKITFRADDDLIDQLEAFDASKSEVMRRALRSFLDENAETDVNTAETAYTSENSVDELIEQRVDELLETRIEGHTTAPSQPQDINVNITLDGDSVATDTRVDDPAPDAVDERKTASITAGKTDGPTDDARKTCAQCGENVGSEHVYCPNCGEKMSHRVFCECGDELRSDWSFCPSCGRRTPAADVLDSS
jgi:hypothetical protein